MYESVTLKEMLDYVYQFVALHNGNDHARHEDQQEMLDYVHQVVALHNGNDHARHEDQLHDKVGMPHWTDRVRDRRACDRTMSVMHKKTVYESEFDWETVQVPVGFEIVPGARLPIRRKDEG